jgi:hypothetical protein
MMQWIVTLSTGKTSPGFDDMEDVLAWIAINATDAFWKAETKRQKRVEIVYKKAADTSNIIYISDRNEYDELAKTMMVGLDADAKVVGKVIFTKGSDRRSATGHIYPTKRQAKKFLSRLGAVMFEPVDAGLDTEQT